MNSPINFQKAEEFYWRKGTHRYIAEQIAQLIPQLEHRENQMTLDLGRTSMD